MSDRPVWRVSRRKLLTSGLTAGAGLAGLALVGCGDDDDAAKIEGDIGIGFISSFTGPLATVYAPFVNGAKLAIDEINAAGGVRGVKFNRSACSGWRPGWAARGPATAARTSTSSTSCSST